MARELHGSGGEAGGEAGRLAQARRPRFAAPARSQPANRLIRHRQLDLPMIT